MSRIRLIVIALLAACGHTGGGGARCMKEAILPLILSCDEEEPAAPAPIYAAPTLSSMTIGVWYRFVLTSGHWFDAQLVGGDAAAYFVQLPNGVYSVPHANVRWATAFTR